MEFFLLLFILAVCGFGVYFFVTIAYGLFRGVVRDITDIQEERKAELRAEYEEYEEE